MKSGVEFSTIAAIAVESAYEVDLSEIFEDAEGDQITYKVSINSDDYISADENYSYEISDNYEFHTTLIFLASDAEGPGATYTVHLYKVLDKTALKKLIDSVSGENADGFYHSGDKWNGKAYSPTGFWAELTMVNGPLAKARQVYESITADDGQIAAAKSALDDAIANLISVDNANATKLYDAIGANKDRNLSAYTDKSAETFSEALAAAQAKLAPLFDKDGKPTIENVAVDQEAVDDAATALTAAASELLTNTDAKAYYEPLQKGIATILKLTNGFEAKAGDFDQASYEAFAKARTSAIEFRDGLTALNTISERNGLLERYRDIWNAYYIGLKSGKGDITVSLRVSDNYGARLPDYAILDTHTATFDDDVTLTGGEYSLQDLVEAAKIDLTADNAWHTFNDRAVYINGVLVKYSDPSGYYQQGTSVRLTYGSNNRDTSWSGVPLRDGDEVVIARMETPYSNYYTAESYGEANFWTQVKEQVAMLRLNHSGVIEVKEGEAIPLTVSKASALLQDYTGIYSPAGYITILKSEQADRKDDRKPALTDTGVITGSDGSGEITLYREGWYTIAAANLTPPRNGNDYADGSGIPGVFPGLAAADSFTVHVIPLAKDELAQVKSRYTKELTALVASYDERAFTPALWQEVLGIRDTAKSGIETGTSIENVQKAYDMAKTGIADRKAQADAANTQAVKNFAALLAKLPGASEVGELSEADGPNMEALIAAYEGMTPYQRDMLTVKQGNHYKALKEQYGDGTSLSPVKTYKVTFVTNVEECSPGAICKVVLNSDNTNALTNGDFAEISQGTTVLTALNTNLSDFNYDAHGIGVTWSGNTSFKMPRHDVTLEVIFSPKTSEPPDALIATKAAIKADLTSHYNATYQSAAANYSKANFIIVGNAHSDGLAAIDAAVSEAAAIAAKNAAIEALAAVPTKTPGLGKVTVTVENMTWTGPDPAHDIGEPPFKGTIVGPVEVDLDQNTTMMSAVLTVLENAGFTWNDYPNKDIAYLSAIMKDGKRLAEFSSTGGSGWMATLNDWFVNKSLSLFTTSGIDTDTESNKLSDGDEIIMRYEQEYGVDIGSSWIESSTRLKSLDVEAAGKAVALAPSFGDGALRYIVNADGAKSLTLRPEALNKNYQVRTYVNTNTGDWFRQGEAMPARAGDTINIGVAGLGAIKWPSMNNQGAEKIDYTPTWYTLYVIGGGGGANHAVSLIDALPNTVTDANLGDVLFAKTLYDALTKGEQEKVTNKAKLDAVLDALDASDLMKAAKAAIAALPNASEITDATKDRFRGLIGAAVTWCSALTDDQKGDLLVYELQRYTEAVEKLAKLDGDEVARKAPLLSKVGTAEGLKEAAYTAESWAALTGAVTAAKAVLIRPDATQAEVDAAIMSIDRAISALRLRVTLDDDATKAIVEDDNGALPAGMELKLVVEPVGPSSADLEEARGALAGVGTNVLLYDISILDVVSNNRVTQLNGEVRVSLPVPSGMDTARIAVYRIEEDNSRTLLRSEVRDGRVAFYTDHFSLYAIVEHAVASSQVVALSPQPTPIALTSLATLTIKAADKVWNGKRIASGFVLTAGGKRLSAGKDYTVASTGANKDIGAGTVKITGKGAYTGTSTVKFKIVPKAVKLTSAKAGKNSMSIKWTKAPSAEKITRYEVRWKVKGAKSWSSPKAAPSAKAVYTAKKLKKGKTYDVQARAYKTVKGTKYYSAWSPSKPSAKVK
ncbi:MAG: fibronectin type III domain-containing protein [Clostridiales Family XIII bacterium]|nr:fibronectin type III domain-containing protein [Clostridiales Family XIII bacterium]